MVDASASVGAENYPKQLEFVKSLTEKFNLTETGTRAAFVSYTIGDGDSITEFGFQTDIESFNEKVDEIVYADGFTLTGAAIEHAYIDIIRKEARPDAAVSIIVLTDGFSFDDVKTPSDLLRSVQIEMFAIGVKNYSAFKNFDPTTSIWSFLRFLE